MRRNSVVKKPILSLAVFFLLVILACGQAAAPAQAPAPTAPPAPEAEVSSGEAPAAGEPAAAPTSAPALNPPPTAGPTSTPVPVGTVSARDGITLVIAAEPVTVDPLGYVGGTSSSVVKDNLVDSLTWQSGDDLRIVPTPAATGWEQLAPDRWRFHLREGVTFHNGEEWNAQAALPSLAFQGVSTNDNSSYGYTGGHTSEAVDDFTVDINCDQPCPIFPNTAFFLHFTAPDFFVNSTEDERALQAVGFGPYRQTEWSHGVSITMEAFEDYVTVDDHFEFQKPYIKEAKWLWRAETTVMSAMVQAGEADIAWDVGVDAIGILDENQLTSGGSAEVYGFWINTLWHPELTKKKVRQAMVHSINCQEIVDTLFGGLPPCRGNIMWPGVIGASARNTAPYEYNPDLARQLLAEAAYDPDNVVKIGGRSARIPKQVELYETLHAFMTEVGFNVEITVLEPSIRNEMRNCAIGKAISEVLEAQGKDPQEAEPTLADMQAALDKGGANCPTGHVLSAGGFSNETLDFGRQATRYLNCAGRSFACDPTPGGLQEKLLPALSASGEERQRLLEELADRVHDDVLLFPMFDLPVFYAIDPKLEWTPRFDRRIRVSAMWFGP